MCLEEKDISKNIQRVTGGRGAQCFVAEVSCRMQVGSQGRGKTERPPAKQEKVKHLTVPLELEGYTDTYTEKQRGESGRRPLGGNFVLFS